jgi:hypothetical protein
MKTRVDRLMDAVLPSWSKCLGAPYGNGNYKESPEGTTYCNEFVQEVLNKLSYQGLNGKRASEMVDTMATSADWLEIPGPTAISHACNGSVVIAGWKNPDPSGHGHVCIIIPGEGATSGKWNIQTPDVPKVANVGKLEYSKIGIGANWAFGEMPKYFVLKSSIVEA